jgi:5-methylcytosine-specific restriction endonuclease McrA
MKIDVRVKGKWYNKKLQNKLENKYKLKLVNIDGVYMYEGSVKSSWAVTSLKRLCKQNKVKFELNNDFGKRSTTYRTEYFKHNKPIYKKFYRCVYCGRLLSRRKITVDHIYPVKKVNESTYYQDKLKKMGADSVNDYRNLVSACFRCNAKKSAKTGWWIIKAKIGSIKYYWPIVHMIEFIIILFILYNLYINRIIISDNLKIFLENHGFYNTSLLT